ncbi:3'-5' exonuclease [Tomitella biformata]|uniref:3'-5' exonuclease n=1 Tax=Tomitella biformata TaxID=630403 RepID=UPI0004638AF9|nr:3'-5' exonuclease [Tomitella biformata]
MSTWSEQSICAFDLETTGPDPSHARIVTACVATITGTEISSRTWLLDPQTDIPQGATNVHGITTEHAREHGQDYAAGYSQIRDALTQAWAAGQMVVAFNASFDLTLMNAEGLRLGLTPLDPGLVVDPFVIDREMDKYRRGKRTLGDVSAHYGVPLENSHEAEADALAAAHLVRALTAKYPQITTLDIVSEQTAWHAERQRDFAAYLTRQGKDASDVNGEWPIRQSC